MPHISLSRHRSAKPKRISSGRKRLIASAAMAIILPLCLIGAMVFPGIFNQPPHTAPFAVAATDTSSAPSVPTIAPTLPPPVPTDSPTPRPMHVPAPPYQPVDGSWVASAPQLNIRFFAVPAWEQRAVTAPVTQLRLSTPAGAAAFQNLLIIRAQICCSDSTAAWQTEADAYTKASLLENVVITAPPRPQQAAGFDGYLGQFHYSLPSDHNQYDVTLWVGDVSGDRVLLIFTCDPALDAAQDQAVSQVLGTIDFNAK